MRGVEVDRGPVSVHRKSARSSDRSIVIASVVLVEAHLNDCRLAHVMIADALEDPCE